MKSCSVYKMLQVVPGTVEDYKTLSRYHYRDTGLGPYVCIFALRPDDRYCWRVKVKTVGVIVYTMPVLGSELRSIATGGMFTGLDSATRLALINKNIRCISRVIIEPRFRSLGLASRLVRETMPLLDVPVIEAMAVMGMVNPFFEKAGMKPFTAPPTARCIRLIEALDLVGIEGRRLIDADFVHRKIGRLPKQKADFIESEIKLFLQSYGKRRFMSPGMERTRYILTKLTDRPVYYVWFNKNLELRM